jgi:hypothetical protein
MSGPTEPRIVRQYASRPSPIPRHLRQPGEDGYRTPIIEDPEHPAHHRQRNVQSVNLALNQLSDGHDQGDSPGLCSDPENTSRREWRHLYHHHHHHHHHHDRCHLPEGFPKNLNWKQRIKHVTWAYFTLTMATGGTEQLWQRITTTTNTIKESLM